MKRTAFTLIEVMVVIAIIALLAAIIFPLYRSSLRESRIASATQNLRSTLMAMAMYKEQASDYPVDNLQPLIDTNILSSGTILSLPEDKLERGFAGELLACRTNQPDRKLIKQSMEVPFFGVPIGKHLEQRLLPYDSNPGLLAIRVFGQEDPLATCNNGFPMRYEGFMLRGRIDGSVERTQLKFTRGLNPLGQDSVSLCNNAIFTDALEACKRAD